MFNSIFGSLGQQAITGLGQYQNNAGALQNAYSPYAQQSQLAANQQMAQYNQALSPPQWVIDGKRFNNAEEFARHIWPDDDEARLMFCLKYPV